VSDQLTDGRRYRILTVVEGCTRECLALVADTSRSPAWALSEPGWMAGDIDAFAPTACCVAMTALDNRSYLSRL